jgi:hypothetical protein
MEVWFKSSLLTLLFDLGRWDEVVETAAWIVNWGTRAWRPLRHRVGRQLHRPGALLAGAGRGRP